MEDINRLQYLLDNVSVISKKYEDIAKKTGENFNVFSIMSMEKDERYTHSAIICELLNPKGSHSKGSKFLRLFFEEINSLKAINNFDFEDAEIISEEFIGRKNNDTDFSGFIDIVIKDKNIQIVIENKIHAKDQYEQLKRYKNHYPNCVLLYLNLNGKLPEKYSSVDLEINKDFFIITYYEEIKKWLEKCLKEVNNHPILYATITQYLNLVKKLTNQTQNNKMKSEIIETIKNNLTYSNLIFQNYIQAKNEILNSIKDKVFKKLTNEFSEKYLVHMSNEGVDKPNSSIIIKPKEFENESSFFCINSFSGIVSSENLFNSTLFIGILDYEEHNRNHFLNSELKNIGWWWEIENIVDEDSFMIKFADLDFLQKLANNLDKKEILIDCIFNSAVKYINNNEEKLFNVLENKKLL
jgi:hypothetical protein